MKKDITDDLRSLLNINGCTTTQIDSYIKFLDANGHIMIPIRHYPDKKALLRILLGSDQIEGLSSREFKDGTINYVEIKSK
ncbi:hypothetical protein [Liquorilactobacillus oeni]|uniref:hypothetical protein n=1 Tax=Liquorilactobacillus oeni TaxID=303241 RepID=UPI00070C6530|nr:hypothetical protein [Liquorilactobacillus oeni]